MHRIEVRITLSLSETGRVPEVRLWVDSSPDGALSSESELALQATGALEWRTVLELDERCQEFTYRIGLRAHPEAQWSLRFRDCRTGVELFADGDRLMLTKGWSVGRCSVNRSHLSLIRGKGSGAC